MGFPQSVAEKALVACGRCCCICHVFCGTKIELHHIKPKSAGGSDDFDNCIPLCFNCHAEMGKPTHHKGRGYDEKELKGHRDTWYARKKESLQTAVSVCAADKQQFEQICSLFAQAKYVLTEHDMAAAFCQNDIEGLFCYADRSDDPFTMFIDADLEMLRSKLLVQLNECVAIFRRYLYWHNGPSRDLCVSDLWLYYHGKKLKETPEQLQEFEEKARRLTQVAEATWAEYVSFVQQMRFRIGSNT